MTLDPQGSERPLTVTPHPMTRDSGYEGALGRSPQRLAALVFVTPTALDGNLTVAARLIAAKSILWPDRNPSQSFLSVYFGMARRTVVAAQRELADHAGFEYEWAKGHPTRRQRHRIVNLPPRADPMKSTFGYVGHHHAELLHGQKNALMLLGMNSTGVLLNVHEAADILGVSRRTADRAWATVRGCLGHEGTRR